MRHGEVRQVRFSPARRDDLKPETVALVDGDPFEVMFAWIADEGPYEGQAVWIPTDHSIKAGWIPDCDLVDTPV